MGHLKILPDYRIAQQHTLLASWFRYLPGYLCLLIAHPEG